MKKMVSFMDKTVSLYVLLIAFFLALFMIFSIGSEVFLLLKSGFSGGFESTGTKLLENFLHTIAMAIILVKAYLILIAYAKTQHLNLKFLVEISIIAPSIEIIFNASKYDFKLLVLFAGFAIANLVLYLIFYKTIKQVDSDYKEHHE